MGKSTTAESKKRGGQQPMSQTFNQFVESLFSNPDPNPKDPVNTDLQSASPDPAPTNPTEVSAVLLVPQEDTPPLQEDTPPLPQALVQEDTPPSVEPAVQEDPKPEMVQQVLANTIEVPSPEMYRHSGERYTLIFDGVCSHCAHCGQGLTDEVSIERGIGPICSKKGYNDEEMKVIDATDALIALAEFPALVKYMMDRYAPQGNKALVKGLVRVASLNRKTPVHEACCEAIAHLGWTKLASLLRESLSIVRISNSKSHDGHYVVWVKKNHYKWAYSNDVAQLHGSFFSKAEKGMIVPKERKRGLAEILVKHYKGFSVKTDTGAFKITEDWFKSH